MIAPTTSCTDDAIVAEVLIDAPRAAVWAALTQARLLERWIASPTLELPAIKRRQSLVGELLAQPSRLAALRELLGQVRDIPRILGRLQNRLRNPRELGGVAGAA